MVHWFMDKEPSRPVNKFDRRCDKCREPMIGIMRVSDMPPINFSVGNMGAPRKICVECENDGKAAS